MNLSIKQLRPGIYELFLNIPYDYQTVLYEFENEEWEGHSDRKTSAGLAGDPYAERSGLLNPKSTVLQEIQNSFNSDIIKKQLIDHIYAVEGKYISSLWDGWTKEQMFEKTFWGSMFNRDLPGFHIKPHLDTRLQVMTAMIYFSYKDDPDQSTIYYNSESMSFPLRAKNDFGRGVIHVNDHTSWHEGFNKSLETRYSLIAGLLIRTIDESK